MLSRRSIFQAFLQCPEDTTFWNFGQLFFHFLLIDCCCSISSSRTSWFCFSVGFRSLIEHYALTTTEPIPVSRAQTSHSQKSLARCASPGTSKATKLVLHSRSDADRTTAARKRALLALKCNVLCHFDIQIVEKQKDGRSAQNIAAIKEYDRMMALHIAVEKMDETLSRAKSLATVLKYGVHVADM